MSTPAYKLGELQWPLPNAALRLVNDPFWAGERKRQGRTASLPKESAWRASTARYRLVIRPILAVSMAADTARGEKICSASRFQ